MTSDDRHPVDELAEEFAHRIRSGESPEIDDYCQKHPEHAAMIRAVFPSIALVERASLKEDQSRQSEQLPGSRTASTHPGEQKIGATPATRRSALRILGDFEIVREIGRGGMGIVYQAIQRSLNRQVALKVIGAAVANSERQLRRFRREAESAASLHHSNIVPVYGIGEDQGLQYYAMQLIDGVTLAEVVRHLQTAKTLPSRSTDPVATRDSTSEVTTHRENRGSSHRLASAFATEDAVLQLFGTTMTQSIHAPATSGTEVMANPIAGTNSVPPSSRTIEPTLQATHQGMYEDDENALDSQDGSDDKQQTQERRGSAASKRIQNRRSQPTEGSIQLNTAYVRNVARLVAHAANAVDYAHRQGILHRDIKPANLLLDRDGTVWVADFGLARRIEMDGVTQTGEIVGTLRYMAPEQLEGKVDRRTDIYALGITLYELIALRPAVDSPRLLSGKFQHAQIPRLRTWRPEIPADLDTIVMKACSADPTHRYQTARELEADLRRFLEDRPIHARHVSLLERAWRWSRRNPVIASLSAATVTLLVLVAVILGFGNYRLTKALKERNDALADRDIEFSRAEQNLAEKTLALDTARREQNRAELNLDLAIKAFEEVFNNIAARGRSESLADDLSEEDFVAAPDAVLSSADVTLLETLLRFFDQLAQQNSKDLEIESALARRRVGDIQQQLGRLADAESSYRDAEARLQTALEKAGSAAAATNPDSEAAIDPDLQSRLVLSLAEVRQQLMLIAAKRGDYAATMRTHQQVRSTLEQGGIDQSNDGKFLLATTINRAVAMGLRLAIEPRFRPRNPILNRLLPNMPDELPPPPGQAQRLRRETEAAAEAITLLKELIAQDASNAAYRVSLAEAYRNQSRVAQIQRDWRTADESLSEAIRILEALIDEFPQLNRFQYELADTLSNVVSFRPADMQRLMKSQQICRDLVKSNPDVPEYRSLLATTLSRIAGIHFSQSRPERAENALTEAVTLQEQLVEQFPDVVAYQFSLARSLQQLAQVYVSQKKTDDARRTYDSALQRLEPLVASNRFRNILQPLISRLRENRSKLE